MLWVRPVPAILVGLILLAAPAASDFPCGTSEWGGIVGVGNYTGAGVTCALAKKDLEEDMGMVRPDCEDCPAGQFGCIGRVVVDDADEDNVVFGNCYLDEITGLYVTSATVSAQANWDKVCTSCKPVQGG